ncbi:hypothetical protein HN499_05990 [archaeon]|nr:hypothetical protein [archaeon]
MSYLELTLHRSLANKWYSITASEDLRDGEITVIEGTHSEINDFVLEFCVNVDILDSTQKLRRKVKEYEDIFWLGRPMEVIEGKLDYKRGRDDT